jgi:hypothetical protein
MFSLRFFHEAPLNHLRFVILFEYGFLFEEQCSICTLYHLRVATSRIADASQERASKRVKVYSTLSIRVVFYGLECLTANARVATVLRWGPGIDSKE